MLFPRLVQIGIVIKLALYHTSYLDCAFELDMNTEYCMLKWTGSLLKSITVSAQSEETSSFFSTFLTPGSGLCCIQWSVVSILLEVGSFRWLVNFMKMRRGSPANIPGGSFLRSLKLLLLETH